jgi:hypothetical protein
MKTSIRYACAAALVAGGLAGCATEAEREFGSSVRHMITGQKFDPAAPTDTMGAVSAQKAADAVGAYHDGKKVAPAPTPKPTQ